ncbi:MAG: OmpH family outer membrane protein [Acidobacteria bacterium]|nr:OmpH family outer membrane protein [Acidobacteriota bacterium]
MTSTIGLTLHHGAMLAATLWLGFGGSAALEAQEVAESAKVGVIDVRRILTESEAGRQALSTLRGMAETRQAEISSREEEMTELKARLEAGRLQLSEDKQKQMEQELQGMIIELGRAQDDGRREIEERQIAEFGSIEQRIMPLIRSVGEELGYTLIFNKFEDSGLLFAAPGADITDLVLQRFDALSEDGEEE